MKTLFLSILSIFLLNSCGNQATTKDPGAATENQKEIKEVETKQKEIPGDVSFSFDDNRIGEIPSGWSGFFTGKGKSGKWKVLDDNGNNVLAQTSMENFGYHFDVIVNDELIYKDLEITLKFKGVEGKEDQGGGPVWRYQDVDNYYIARANPLENNYRLYKVVDGNRKMLESIDIDVTTGEWHTVKIIMKGNRMECYYNGELHLSTTDNTFTNAGKIGLWTKADAVTYFDDLQIVGSF